MALGLSNDDCGTLDVKSSSNLVNNENAGRTGYSWSVMITPSNNVFVSRSSASVGLYLTSQLLCSTTIVDMRYVVVFLHALSLPLGCPFGYSLGQEIHKFADRTPLVKGERGEIIGIYEDTGRARRRGQNDRY